MLPLKYILPRSNIINYTCENRQYNCCTYWSPDNPWSSTIENTFFKGSVISLYNLYFIFRRRYWINLKTFFSKSILWNGQGERISKIEFPLLFSNYTLWKFLIGRRWIQIFYLHYCTLRSTVMSSRSLPLSVLQLTTGEIHPPPSLTSQQCCNFISVNNQLRHISYMRILSVHFYEDDISSTLECI